MGRAGNDIVPPFHRVPMGVAGGLSVSEAPPYPDRFFHGSLRSVVPHGLVLNLFDFRRVHGADQTTSAFSLGERVGFTAPCLVGAPALRPGRDQTCAARNVLSESGVGPTEHSPTVNLRSKGEPHAFQTTDSI